MTEEMRALQEKAEKGDAESQFYFGKALALGEGGVAQNYDEALRYLRLAGEALPGAFNLMIGISMKGACKPDVTDKRFCTANPELLIEGFEGKIYKHNSYAACITFGAILCGHPDNRHFDIHGGMPELAGPKYVKPARGFKLIREGVIALEKEAEETGNDPIDYTSYLEVHLAYDHHTQLPREPGKPYHFTDEIDVCVALASRAVFAGRAYTALLERRGLPNYILNDYSSYLNAGMDRMMHEAAVQKLKDFHKIYLAKESLVGGINNMLGTGSSAVNEEHKRKITEKIDELRRSGYKVDKDVAKMMESQLAAAISELERK